MSPEDTASPPPAPRVRRWGVVGGIALLLYLLVGFMVVPWVIRRQVVGQSRARLHREASLAQARFNPFTLAATLVGFDLRDRDSTPLLAFDTLVVNLSTTSLFKRALVLDEFRLVRPAITARILASGDPAIADLLAEDSTAAPADTVFAPPRLVVRQASIRDGTIHFSDRSRAPVYEEQFTDLGLAIDEFSTLPREDGDHVLTVRFATGAEVRWSGNSSFHPLVLTGEFTLAKANLPRLARVFASDAPLTLTEGVGAGALQYRVTQAPSGAFQLSLPGASMDLRGLAARPAGVAEDWARIAAFEVEGVELEYPARTATVALVRVTDPWLAVTRRADSTINWMAVIDQFTAGGDTAAPAAPWTATVRQVEVTGGGVRFIDETITPAAAQEVSQVAIRLGPVGTDLTVLVGIEASGTLGDSGRVAAKGTVVRAPLGAELALEATGLQLALVQPYLGAGAPARLTGGTASAKGTFRMRDGKPRMAFDGDAALTRFALEDTTGGPILNWQAMAIRGIRYTSAPDLLRIRTIRFDRPFARVAISREREINLMALADMMPAVDTTKPLPYEVQEVLIRDARIDFSDESLILPFRALIDSTQGAVRDIASFGGTPGSLELGGWIAPNGSLSAKGNLHLSDPMAATSVAAGFRNVDMTQLTPYSAEFAGYAIKEGRLDVDIDYKVQDRKLDASHRIVADNMSLGEKVEGGGAPGFLVKLAISLLKDSQGRIIFDVPVTGSVDDPEFRYSAVIWQGVKQVLGKVATAPFRFLGGLLGIKGDDVDLVDFDAGRAEVDAPEREKLDSIAAELGRRPELVLQIEGRYDTIADLAAAREAALAEKVTARRDASSTKVAAGDTATTALAKILEALYAEQFTAPALDSLRAGFMAVDSTVAGARPALNSTAYFTELRKRLLAAQPVAPDLPQRLGTERAAAIAAALTARGVLDSSRVTITGTAPVSRKKAGSARIASELKMDAP